MDRLDKNIIYATLSFVIVGVGCVFISKEFIDSMLESVVVTLFVSVALGYIISSTLLLSKRKQDYNLHHLTKEILHELNIPISTIQLNSSMLKRKVADAKMLKRIDRIEASSKRLESLYKELSYAIKKEIQKVPKEEFDLRDMIEKRVDIFLEFGRNSFEVNVPECMIYTDKIGFEKTIDNLISNAMKYSDRNSTIKIYCKENTLYIQDSGIGMDEIELLRVFERYYQADHKQDGKGIGLAIVKEFCENNSITIDISSKKYYGTKISLKLNNIIL